jgi:hypothetical protein
VVPGIFPDDDGGRNRSFRWVSAAPDTMAAEVQLFNNPAGNHWVVRAHGSGDAAAELFEGFPSREFRQEQGLDLLEAFAVGA